MKWIHLESPFSMALEFLGVRWKKRQLAIFPLLAFLAAVVCPSVHAAHTTHLRGIIHVPEMKAALVEVVHDIKRPPTKPHHVVSTTRLLREGEFYEDVTIKGAVVAFEILRIDPATESVLVRENGEAVVYALKGSDRVASTLKTGKPGFRFHEARVIDALNVYSDLTHRTVLLHSGVKRLPVSVGAEAKTPAEIATAMEISFREHGLVVIPDGDTFALVVPQSMEERAQPHSRKLVKDSPSAGSFATDGIVDTIVDAYGRLLGRTLSESTPHPNRPVYLQTRTLTKAEMQYAFDRLLEWNGLRVEVVDEKQFRVVPWTKVARP